MKRIDRNAGIPGRKPNWWIRYEVKGREVREPGKGSERADRAYMAELRRQIKLGTWVHPSERGASALFKNYAEALVKKRAEKGGKGAQLGIEGSIVRLHLNPVFGECLMRDLTYPVILRGFEETIFRKGLAPRMVHNVHGLFRCIVKAAAKEGLMDMPPMLGHEELPAKVDKDPKWRNAAVFDTREVPLIAALDIASTYKVMFLVYFCTGARLSEILPLTLRDYEERKPLRCLLVIASKTRGGSDRRRQVPVHPDLERWLDWWIEHEYQVVWGRPMGLDDLLFPSLSSKDTHGGVRPPHRHTVWRNFTTMLRKAGLRHRWVHDMRRTLLSAMHNAEVEDSLRRKVTHHSVKDRVLDGYTISDWRLLCEAVSAVHWGLPNPTAKPVEGTNVVQLRSRNT